VQISDEASETLGERVTARISISSGMLTVRLTNVTKLDEGSVVGVLAQRIDGMIADGNAELAGRRVTVELPWPEDGPPPTELTIGVIPTGPHGGDA